MKKKFYITTSIAYTNLSPHLGFALELVQADVLARHYRILGQDAFFLTGTDEHGKKVAEAAEKIGKSPAKFSSEISTQFKALTKILNLSNNDFIRTTDKKRHWPSVKEVWLKLRKNGDIYKKKYQGLYCLGCEAFIVKKDLIQGRCKIHQKEPEAVEEENYFFRLSKYQKQIKKILEKEKIKLIPQSRKNEMLSFLKEGLEDVSFSRPRKDLKWGIPVPHDHTQTIYCWVDALTNYISGIGYVDNKSKFKKFWPADIHCIGKDIQKFHCLIWPGMLLSLGLELPRIIFVHGFITVDGQKMSKSLGNIVDPFELVEKYGADAVRYFLLREIPPTEDGDFTYQKFEQRYNSDLAKGLGNLVARVIKLAQIFNFPRRKTCGFLRGRQFSIFNQFSNPKFQNIVNETWKNYHKDLEDFKFNEALIAIWKLIGFCDRYIEKERPWENKNQKSKIKNQKVINDLLCAITEIAKLLAPFLPETSEKILKNIRQLAEKTKKGKPLFPRLK